MKLLNLTDEYLTVHNHDGSRDQLEPGPVACRTLQALQDVPPEVDQLYIVTPELWSAARENGYEAFPQLVAIHGELPDGRFVGLYAPGPAEAACAPLDDDVLCTD